MQSVAKGTHLGIAALMNTSRGAVLAVCLLTARARRTCIGTISDPMNAIFSLETPISISLRPVMLSVAENPTWDTETGQ